MRFVSGSSVQKHYVSTSLALLSKQSILFSLVVLDLVLLQSLGNMLLFQYLVNVLEGDFQPRNCVYAGKLILFYFYFLFFVFFFPSSYVEGLSCFYSIQKPQTGSF